MNTTTWTVYTQPTSMWLWGITNVWMGWSSPEVLPEQNQKTNTMRDKRCILSAQKGDRSFGDKLPSVHQHFLVSLLLFCKEHVTGLASFTVSRRLTKVAASTKRRGRSLATVRGGRRASMLLVEWNPFNERSRDKNWRAHMYQQLRCSNLFFLLLFYQLYLFCQYFKSCVQM